MISDPANHTERLDAISREICRLFNEGDRFNVVNKLAECNNKVEVALVVAWAVPRMSEGQRKSFVDFLNHQVLSLQV